jgi:hypothetical protein
MTSRRFESIGGILNRTATDLIPTSEADEAALTASVDTAPAAVTNLRPASQHPRRADRQPVQLSPRRRPAPMGECVGSRSGSTPPCTAPSPRERPARRPARARSSRTASRPPTRRRRLPTWSPRKRPHHRPAASSYGSNPRSSASNRLGRDPPRRPSRHRPRPARHPDRRRLPHPAHRRRPPPPPPLTDPIATETSRADVAGTGCCRSSWCPGSPPSVPGIVCAEAAASKAWDKERSARSTSSEARASATRLVSWTSGEPLSRR